MTVISIYFVSALLWHKVNFIHEYTTRPFVLSYDGNPVEMVLKQYMFPMFVGRSDVIGQYPGLDNRKRDPKLKDH